MTHLSEEVRAGLDELKAAGSSNSDAQRKLSSIVLSQGEMKLQQAIAVEKELLELTVELDGNQEGMTWLLQLLADHISLQFETLSKFTKKEEAELLEHMEGLTLFPSTFLSDSSAAAVDFAVAVYVAGSIVGSKVSEKVDPTTLLTELESSRGALKVLLTSATSSHAVKTRCAQGLRNIILLLTPEIAGKSDGFPSHAEKWVSLKVPTHREELFNANQVVGDCIETLAACLESPTCPQLLSMSILSACHLLTRVRPSTWSELIPRICAVVKRVFDTDRSGKYAANPLRSSAAVKHTLHRYFHFVMQIAKAISFHETVQAALQVTGASANTVASAKTAATGLPPNFFVPTSKDIKAVHLQPAEFLHPVLDDQLPADGDVTAETTSAAKNTATAAPIEVLATTNHGPITNLRTMVAMIIRSLKDIPLDSEVIEVCHQKGLQQMQYNAAKAAQALEIERTNQQESRSIGEVPPGRLVERVNQGAEAMEQAELLLGSEQKRAMFVRSAFFSALNTCRQIRFESRSRMRHVHALLARVYCELPLRCVDSATDTLCDYVVETVVASSAQGMQAELSPFVRDLVLQVLFMRYAQLAVPPSGMAQALAGLATAADRTRTLDSSGLSFKMLLEDPIAWLTSHSRRKRRREAGEEDDAMAELTFVDDKPEQANAYSYLMCRMLSVLLRLGAERTIEQLLLAAPALTPPIWLWIHTQLVMNEEPVLGLSDDQRRLHNENASRGIGDSRKLLTGTVSRQVQVGIVILTSIISRRTVHRLHALSLLLSYSTSTKPLPRMLSIRALNDLATSKPLPTDVKFGRNEVDWRQHILDYAKLALGKITAWRIAKFEAQVNPEETSEEEAKQQALKKYEALINRHAQLFLLLTASPQHVVGMFRNLLEVLAECSSQHNLDAQNVLLASSDFVKFACLIYKAPALLLPVLQEIQRFPTGAEAVVQHLLRIFVAQLQEQVDKVLLAPPANHPTLTAGSKKDQKLSAAKQFQIIVKSLVTVCERLFDEISIEMQDGTTCNDARFLVPVLSFIERDVLRTRYIPAVLRLAAAEYSGRDPELLDYALREVLTPCRVAYDRNHNEGAVASAADLPERGMDPIGLMVYLHQVLGARIQGMTEKKVVTGISTLLKMKRVVGPEKRTELLYNSAIVAEALQHLIRVQPVPSLTMRTAIVVSRLHKDDQQLLRFIANTVVRELVSAQIWERDETLWRGVVMFFTEQWPNYGTKEAVLKLPQNVLLATLRQQHNREFLKVLLASLSTLPLQYTELLAEFLTFSG
jgi:hypothetical protein